MNIAFRVDASAIIGTGHLMRCLTLADTLTVRGVLIRFVCRHLPEYFQDMLSEKGYEFILLGGSTSDSSEDDLVHSHWLESSQNSDAQAVVLALSDRTWDWLVVDHYALDARWESALRQTAKKFFVIDDIADRRHDCDILLDQNFYADMNTRYTEKVPGHCELLLGPRYALLRDEFCRLRQQVKLRTGPVRRILVFLGGIDTDNYTQCAIEALENVKIYGISVDVVIGAQHPYREDIKSSCIELGFDCYVQTSHIAELMASADLAIGAGGSATWERCCLGLPTLTVSLANNQTEIAKGLELSGACQYVGSQQMATVKVLHNAVVELLKNNNRLQEISDKAFSCVDGLGVDRVCKELMS